MSTDGFEPARIVFDVLDHVPVGVCVLRKDFSVVFWNRCLSEWTGMPKDTIVGKDIGQYFPHLKSAKYAMRLEDIFLGGPPTIFSSQLHGNVIPSVLGDGKLRVEHVTATAVRAPAEEGFYALLFIQDVSDLTHRIRDYRAMRDQALDEIRERRRAEDELLKAREGLELRVRERTSDLVALNEQLAREITERKHAVEALKQSEERYRTLFEESRDAIYISSRDGAFIDVNEAALNLFGYGREEMLGLNVREIYLNPADRDRFRRDIEEKGSVRDYEIPCRRKDGRELHCLLTATVRHDTNGNILGYQGIFRDVTERRRMEEDLLRARKLESVGVLAGGIAHDFDNLLTAILGSVSLARMYMEGGGEAHERLAEAEKAAIRARDLTGQLLSFSAGFAPARKKALEVGDLIRDAAAGATAGCSVICEFSVVQDLWPVEVDADQIRQVIHNLVVNACQAMTEGGTVQVLAENVTVRPEDILPLSVGNYVRLSVKDHGIGIAPEHLGRIFDPYFTTKKKGNGLGLATAYSIIKSHNGFITAESKPGAGATFYVYLPASRGAVLAAGEKEMPAGRKGRVLVMDDEELVRLVAGNILAKIGYDVEYANDGGAAVERYREAMKSGNAFDVVLMDLNIKGGIGGREALRMLTEIDPDVKAVVSSGYASDAIMTDFAKSGFRGAVAKPYTIKEMSDVLSAVIKEADKTG